MEIDDQIYVNYLPEGVTPENNSNGLDPNSKPSVNKETINQPEDWDNLEGSDKPEDNATKGATIGSTLKDSSGNIIEDDKILNIIEDETAGEAIDASTTPQAVYKDTSDGKVYLTDANDSTGGHRRFYGFIADEQNLSVNDTCKVRIQGRVTGFSSLTSGQFLYLTDTPGGTSHTASTDTVIRVGMATSTTEIFIISKGMKMVTGSISSACDGNDLTTTVTVGWRAKLVLLFGILNGNNSGSCNANTTMFSGAWSDSNGQGGIDMDSSGNAGLNSATYIGTATGAEYGARAYVANVGETSFQIILEGVAAGTGGVGDVFSGSAFYVAFGE